MTLTKLGDLTSRTKDYARALEILLRADHLRAVDPALLTRDLRGSHGE